MRQFLRALSFLGLCLFLMQNPLAEKLRRIWLPDVLEPLSDNRELVALSVGFIALCIMAVGIGAARSSVPLGEIARALFHK